MDIRKLKSEIKEKKGLANENLDIWSFIQKPIGKAYYKHNQENTEGDNVEDNKIHWSDKIKCKVCGREYTRSNVSNHKKSQFHRTYENINNKVRKFILAE